MTFARTPTVAQVPQTCAYPNRGKWTSVPHRANQISAIRRILNQISVILLPVYLINVKFRLVDQTPAFHNRRVPPTFAPMAAKPLEVMGIFVVTGENDNPDECIPAVNEPDLCSTDTGTDFCRNPGSGIVEPDNCDPDPDICYEGGQNVVDICDPDNGDPDTDPNVLQLTNFNARSDMTTLGAFAALGAAALLRPRKENDPSE